MSTTREFRQLGMDRRIPRRDFLNGMALGVAGAAMVGNGTAPLFARAQAPAGEPAYPPLRLGLRGQHASAIAAFDAIKRGDFAAYPSIDVDTSETYDLVIVGGGLSGLAAAYFWHRALPDQRVLDSRQPRRLRRPRQAQRVRLQRPHLPGLRRHA